MRTNYAVVSEDIWRVRLSAGYGTGPDRMKGIFGGAEFKAFDWLYLLGENDTKETNVGARLVTPQFWKIPVSFNFTAKTSLEHKPGTFDVAFGLSMPLDFRVKQPRTAPQASTPLSQQSAVVSSQTDQATPNPPTVNGQRSTDNGVSSQTDKVRPNPQASTPLSQQETGTSAPSPMPAMPAFRPPAPAGAGANEHIDLSGLRDCLVREGFTNVRVGVADTGILVVEYEDVRFNHNELDGMGVVAGNAARLAEGRFESLRMVMKRHDIPMVRLTMPLKLVAGFLDGSIGQTDFSKDLVVSFAAWDDDVDFLAGTGNPGFLKSSLVLAPVLTTFVGTEFGAFDYLLSLQPELLVNAWKGGVVDARWNIPISWSGNLDDGKPFRNSRNPPMMDRLMYFQAFKPLPAFMANLGGGMILHDIYGTLNEATWSPANGTHRIRVVQAYGKDVNSSQATTVYLGSYRYYFSPLDLSLEGTGGRFWSQDRGASLELKRFFGDTAVSLYYKNTEGVDNKKWQAVGIQFSLPLTPRRDMKHYYDMQVRGANEWSYAEETTLTNNNSKGNYLPPYPLAINPQPITDLDITYYNRDRLSEAYIREHLERLRDAWQRYGGEENANIFRQ